jgi:hypothetical protein
MRDGLNVPMNAPDRHSGRAQRDPEPVATVGLSHSTDFGFHSRFA